MPDLLATSAARLAAAVSLALAMTGCVGTDDGPEPGTVGWYETTSCTTDVVHPLAQQIVDEVRCMHPDGLVRLVPGDGIDFTSTAVVPFLAPDARDDLIAAAAAGGGQLLRLSSVYRTVPQQYLVARWFELGRCDVPAAAAPGQSNHESGRSVDVVDQSAWVDLMAQHGWSHDVPGDDVHFDHLASPDQRSADVLAFQRLWNRNTPDDPIAETGVYSDETGPRVARAPADGFLLGASCTPP